MLVLFETAAGFAVFKVLKEKKLEKADLFEDFETPEKASKIVKLKAFLKFEDTTEALSAAAAVTEGKLNKQLRGFLKKLVSSDVQEQLAVADAKLGNAIKEKFSVKCVYGSQIHELMRGIRSQLDSLVTVSPKDQTAMSLGLAHSLSRYKLKFSPDKVDTMIIQAISLLDDLDKELNNYVMRCREWYGWHFPEMGKIVTDNFVFARVVLLVGDRRNCKSTDLSELLPEEMADEVKENAEISMGTEVSEEDIVNIKYMCDQVVEMTQYRLQLYDYLKNRMMAIAPNLTVLVGELVGARLIAHAGSLLNLSKQPSSTVQILGAEKALFRALKTKHDTPKYGLIYHASLITQSGPKHKGKLSRMLAAKAALAIRVDALGEDGNRELGIEHRAKVEARLRQLSEGQVRRISGTGKQQAKWEKFETKSEVRVYDPAADSTLPTKKRKLSTGEELPKKKIKQEMQTPETKKKSDKDFETPKSEKKKKKKVKQTPDVETPKSEKKKKKDKGATPVTVSSEKKKKKKKSISASE